MLHLRLFGALEISASDGRAVEPVVRRSHRAALLAYLAAASPRGFHRRDKLVALFWPESNETHARGALNQALYVLRNSLGDDAIASRGEDIALNRDVVACDVVDFEAALDTGRPGDALALYRADFLDGFHIDGAREFDQWMARERSRLRRRAGDAAWALAESTASRGNVVDATRWARQAADFLPADESVVRRLMTFLRDHGDRAAAVQVYEAFVEWLQQEYDVQPSAETAGLAAAIRGETKSGQPTLLPPSIAGGQPAAGKRVATWRPRAYRAAGVMVLPLAILALLVARPGGDAATRRQPRVAVLPFRNLGSTEERYFADQMTDEVISRLAMMSGVVVVRTRIGAAAPDSSLRDIVADLKVDYFLEGTIKSDRSGRGPAELRFTPRLVRRDDNSLVWSDRYTTTTLPGELFRMQAEIAEAVARALNVTLHERERRLLAAQPTSNPYAYDYYLRGQQYATAFSEQDTRLAIQMYDRAIAADSTFALAHARLAMAHSLAYWFFYDRSSARVAAARRAAERAVALAPDLPESHLALGYYHYWGRNAYADALAEFGKAQALGMNSPDLFKAIANVQRRQGNFGEGVANFERAYVRDPRDMSVVFNLAQSYVLNGAVAQADYYFDRVIQLNPGVAPAYWNRARLHLNAEADTKRARAALDMPGAPAGDSVIQYNAAFIDLLERQYDRALARLRASSAAIETQWRFVPRAELEAMIHGLRGRTGLARILYDSARVMSEWRVRRDSTEANGHSALAIAYAGLGRKREALAEARRAVDLLPVSRDAWRGLYRLEDLARVHAMVGDVEGALEALERLVSLPGGRSIPFLELDPAWDSLRRQPRFRALLAGKS